MSVPDGIPSLPATKFDAGPLKGPANENVTSAEFNALVTAVADLRAALTASAPSEGPAGPLAIASDLFLKSPSLSSQFAMQFKTAGTVGASSNPIFKWGKVFVGGITLPEVSLLYQDDTTPESKRLLIEGPTGTLGVVGDGNRRSHIEAYYQDTTYKPVFRLSSYPSMRVELGAGGVVATAGNVTRSGGVVTVTNTSAPHQFSPGDVLFIVAVGDPNFSSTTGTIQVLATPAFNSFTYNESGNNATNVVTISYSIETDIKLQRAGTNHFQIVMGPFGNELTKVDFFADSMATSANYDQYIGGGILYAPWAVNTTPYSPVQQAVLLVDATSQNIVINLPVSGSYFGKAGRFYQIKKVDSSSNTVTINAAGSDTIDGVSSVVLASQYQTLSINSDGLGHWFELTGSSQHFSGLTIPSDQKITFDGNPNGSTSNAWLKWNSSAVQLQTDQQFAPASIVLRGGGNQIQSAPGNNLGLFVVGANINLGTSGGVINTNSTIVLPNNSYSLTTLAGDLGIRVTGGDLLLSNNGGVGSLKWNSSQFVVDSSGNETISGKYSTSSYTDITGSPGSGVNNAATGRASIASGQSSATITSNNATGLSIIMVQLETTAAGVDDIVVSGQTAGSFTVTSMKNGSVNAVSANAPFSFIVFN